MILAGILVILTANFMLGHDLFAWGWGSSNIKSQKARNLSIIIRCC